MLRLFPVVMDIACDTYVQKQAKRKQELTKSVCNLNIIPNNARFFLISVEGREREAFNSFTSNKESMGKTFKIIVKRDSTSIFTATYILNGFLTFYLHICLPSNQ